MNLNESYEGEMISWAVIFFGLMVGAAIIGFGGIAIALAEIAQILFFVFSILFVISIVSRIKRDR